MPPAGRKEYDLPTKDPWFNGEGEPRDFTAEPPQWQAAYQHAKAKGNTDKSAVVFADNHQESAEFSGTKA